MRKVTILMVFLFIAAFGSYLFYAEGKMPVNKEDAKTKIFVVAPGEGLNNIIKNLAQDGLIRNRVIFYLIVKQLKLEKQIQAGDFRLSPSMSATEIAEALTHGTLDIWVTIPEGLRKEEVANIMAQKLGITDIEFTRKAQEGYLFPETYLIPRQATAETVINLMRNTLNSKFTADMKSKASTIGITPNEVIILASLVERESKVADRQQIANIIVKRYKADWPLQLDATIQYAIGYDDAAQSWWKKNLTVDELAINSPYNTYKNKGLPPGPICNPGLTAIQAIINADINTPYFYYLSDSSGKTYYARTLEEHNANIKKYLKW
ncbi:endolytic transglycosylase MltG [Candidatus Roizmanbacteria bacterium]|nr:endolytic transglycosylase MltG [Candidatus Roizmanbacteria bacterium]